MQQFKSIKKIQLAILNLILIGSVSADSIGSIVEQSGAAQIKRQQEEIVVTASKRSTGLQDTAMSIAAVTGEDIQKKGFVGMGDYLATIPGVSQLDMGPGLNKVSMRGISAGGREDTTVGLYFGEASLNSSSSNAPGFDIKLVDMDRVEVLRGPQGTLFGSGTMGGAIRNIPNAPDLDGLEGEFEAGLSSTDGASGLNNKATAMINVPLVENQLAMRVTAYRFENQGYVDMVSDSDPAKVAMQETYGGVLNNQKDVNDSNYTGARVSFLWQPIEELSANLMHITQDLEQDGMAYSDVNKGAYKSAGFEFNGLFDNQEGRSEDIDLTNLVIEYDLGWGRLTSATTTSEGEIVRDLDDSRFLPWPLAQTALTEADSFTQELRLASELDGPLQFLGGIYYEDLETVLDTLILWSGDDALDPFMGATIFAGSQSSETEQQAFFGELSYDLTSRLTLTLGGRFYDYDRRLVNAFTGIFAPEPTDLKSSEDGSSGKVNISYSINDDSLIYAQWAEGFRLGRPVTVPNSVVCDVDNDGILDGTNTPINTGGVLESDNLENTELGGKFSMLDNRLVINAAAYRIKWDGIPVTVLGTCGVGTELNAGEALSQGMELEISYALYDNLRMDFGLGYNEAELTEDVQGLGSDGDRLPFSPRSNANIGFDYRFDISGYEGFVNASYAYVGGFHTDLAESSEEIGDYGKLSLRTGLAVTDNLDIELYGTNLTNSDGFSGADGSIGFIRVTPRQIGVDARYRF